MQSLSIIRDSNKLEWIIKPSFGNMTCGEIWLVELFRFAFPEEGLHLSKTPEIS